MSPMAPLKPCLTPGCPELVKSGRCTTHRQQRTRSYDANSRPDWIRQFYVSPAWRRLRDQVKREERLCRVHQERGQVALTEQIDHIKSLKTHPELALVRSNLQGLCLPCHRSKTREEEESQR